MRSAWEFVKRDGDIVFIRDLDLGGMSVTNDAEEVFLSCQRHFGPCRMVYQDSEGEWTEIDGYYHDASRVDVRFKPWHGLVWDRLTKV